MMLLLILAVFGTGMIAGFLARLLFISISQGWV